MTLLRTMIPDRANQPQYSDLHLSSVLCSLSSGHWNLPARHSPMGESGTPET